jgi:hypothetical protein
LGKLSKRPGDLDSEDLAGSTEALLGKPKTVAWLMGLTRPKPKPKARSNFERHIYSVEAAVTDVLPEND